MMLFEIIYQTGRVISRAFGNDDNRVAFAAFARRSELVGNYFRRDFRLWNDDRHVVAEHREPMEARGTL